MSSSAIDAAVPSQTEYSKSRRAFANSLTRLLEKPLPDQITRQISRYAKAYRTHLAEAIIILAKEAYGYAPILAPDFDVLHAYLYPSMQSNDKRVPPTLARSVIEQFPGRLLLLPGTVTEIFEHVERTHGLTERLRQATAKLDASESNMHNTLIRLEADLAKLTGTPTATESQSKQELLARLANTFSYVATGFVRLRDLLSDPRLMGLKDAYPGCGLKSPSYALMVDDIAARLTALRAGSKIYYSTHATRCDAHNVAASIDIHNHCGVLSAGEEAANILLVTQTQAVLESSSADFAPDPLLDTLLERGVVLDEYVRGGIRGESWHPIDLSSAFAYCSCRRVGNPFRALNDAIRLHSGMMETSRLTAELHHQQEDGRRRTEVKQLVGELKRSLANTMMRYFVEGAVHEEAKCEEIASFEVSQHLDSPDPTAQLEQTENRASVTVGEANELDAEPSLEIIQLLFQQPLREAQTKISDELVRLGYYVNGDLDAVFDGSVYEMIQPLTSEVLFRVKSWVAAKFVSIAWTTRCSLDDAFCVLRELVGVLDDSSIILATYDRNVKELSTTSQYELYTPKEKKEFPSRMVPLCDMKNLRDLRISHTFMRSKHDNKSRVMPEALSVASDLCDIHMSTPFSAQRKYGVAIHFASQQAAETVIPRLWEHTHPLHWNKEVLSQAMDATSQIIELTDTVSDKQQ